MVMNMKQKKIKTEARIKLNYNICKEKSSRKWDIDSVPQESICTTVFPKPVKYQMNPGVIS